MNAPNTSIILRILALAVFVLATLGVAPVPMTPLGLALWCASTLTWPWSRGKIIRPELR